MCEIIRTPRLILRPFEERDYPALLRIASDPGTVKYLYFWGRNGVTPEQDARRFLDHAFEEQAQSPVTMREYCMTLPESGQIVGEASVEIMDEDTAQLGWILLPEFRGQGYATEAGRAMMDFGFEQYKKDHVIACCDVRNVPSARVMQRLGMRLEHIEKESRPPKYEGGPQGDEATWGIDRLAWAWQRFRALPWAFDVFFDLPELYDGEIRLICEKKAPGDPEKNWVPAYHFLIAKGSESVGGIDLRIGLTDGLFYGGHIGYHVDEAWRGRDFAGRACRLLRPLMRLHGMEAAVITNDVNNSASKRVCEKLGCTFLCRADLPEGNDMRLEDGMQAVNVYLFPAKD